MRARRMERHMIEATLTVTCGDCGNAERFDGELLAAVDQMQPSGRWFLDAKGFTVCGCRYLDRVWCRDLRSSTSSPRSALPPGSTAIRWDKRHVHHHSIEFLSSDEAMALASLVNRIDSPNQDCTAVKAIPTRAEMTPAATNLRKQFTFRPS
jgi:hypothetical protein